MDAAERFPEDQDDRSIVLDPEEREAVRKGLERANQLEKGLRQTREQLRRSEEQKARLQQERRRIKASAPFLAVADLAAGARGVPSSPDSGRVGGRTTAWAWAFPDSVTAGEGVQCNGRIRRRDSKVPGPGNRTRTRTPRQRIQKIPTPDCRFLCIRLG